jgi:DNA uptake protein ComE-like DNA-binding protein
MNRKSTQPNPRRAMVLILVVVVIVMLSLAGLNFVNTMSAENRAVHVQSDAVQLENIVGSGSEFLKVFLEQSRQDLAQAGGTYDNSAKFRAIQVVGESQAKHCGRFTIVAPHEGESHEGDIRFGLENESAKLNLAVLVQWDTRVAGSAQRALMNLPGMTETAAAAILDWVDPDSTTRPNGAEADYYQGIGVPYAPRNGAPQCLDELLLVRGVSRESLFGLDADRNYRIDETERRTASGGSRGGSSSDAPWASLLTVSSAERNETFAGKPRIHLNGRDLASLHRQIAAAFDQKTADFVIFYRQYGPYVGPESPTNDGQAVDLSKPPTHMLASVLDLVGAKVQLGPPGAAANAKPPVVASPLKDEPTALQESLSKLLDLTTLTEQPVVFGKININLAPKAVLRAIPGMDPSLAEQIISARGDNASQTDAGRRYPTWLLANRLVDMAKLKTILPYITCGGDVYRGQIVGFFDDGGPMMRAEVAVDATIRPARQVYWKDLRLLGPGFDRSRLGGDASASPTGPRRGTSPSGGAGS